VSLLIGAACQAAIAAFLLRKDLKAVYAHLYKKVDEIRPTS
jgi:hypothetical protein